VEISPFAQPAQIPEWLAARGFQPGRKWAKMYRGNDPTPATSTKLRVEIIGEDQADAYADVVLSVFHMPPAYRPLVKGSIGKPGWYHYLAFTEDKPVSAAAMFVNGDVAWLGFATTLKKRRRRGGQSALLGRRIADGLALGCKWFVAETEEDTPERPSYSFQNMVRYGFKLAYQQRKYVHRSPMSRAKVVRRALFIAAYSLRFGWQRFMQTRKNEK
jgi:hypothetical protein